MTKLMTEAKQIKEGLEAKDVQIVPRCMKFAVQICEFLPAYLVNIRTGATKMLALILHCTDHSQHLTVFRCLVSSALGEGPMRQLLDLVALSVEAAGGRMLSQGADGSHSGLMHQSGKIKPEDASNLIELAKASSESAKDFVDAFLAEHGCTRRTNQFAYTAAAVGDKILGLMQENPIGPDRHLKQLGGLACVPRSLNPEKPVPASKYYRLTSEDDTLVTRRSSWHDRNRHDSQSGCSRLRSYLEGNLEVGQSYASKLYGPGPARVSRYSVPPEERTFQRAVLDQLSPSIEKYGVHPLRSRYWDKVIDDGKDDIHSQPACSSSSPTVTGHKRSRTDAFGDAVADITSSSHRFVRVSKVLDHQSVLHARKDLAKIRDSYRGYNSKEGRKEAKAIFDDLEQACAQEIHSAGLQHSAAIDIDGLGGLTSLFHIGHKKEAGYTSYIFEDPEHKIKNAGQSLQNAKKQKCTVP